MVRRTNHGGETMSKRQLLYTAIALFTISVLVSSCSQPPSDGTFKSAITEHLKQEVPFSWSGTLMPCEKTQIELIEIKQIGKFNDQDKYWPVKARVKGTCQSLGMYETITRALNQDGDFKIYQDDYGNWKAAIYFP